MTNEQLLTQSEIENVIDKVFDRFLRPELAQQNVNDTGRLSQSLEARSDDNQSVEVWAQFYANWADEGRSAGKMPPFDAIHGWVQRKLHKSGDEAKSIAFAIMKKIAKEGTTAKRIPHKIFLMLESQDVILFIKNEFKQILIQKVSQQLLNAFKNEFNS